jgi:hypothetical protein
VKNETEKESWDNVLFHEDREGLAEKLGNVCSTVEERRFSARKGALD